MNRITLDLPKFPLTAQKQPRRLSTMKALVLTADATLEVAEYPEPSAPESGWVTLRVACAGVCGSDIPRGFEGGAYHYPLVMGHEFSGTVERTAAGSRFSLGDRVAVFPLIPNPAEEINQVGEYAVGRAYDYFGSRRDGAFQELLNVPEFNLLSIHKGLSLEAASLVEPCAVAYHAAARPAVSPGESALVIGGGPIGNMVAQWLRLRGCRPVFVSEPDQKKRRIAERMGFISIDPAASDPVESTAYLPGGGADVVVEACGLPVTFRQAVSAAGLFGQVVFLGNIHGELRLDEKLVSSILRRELTIYGTWNSRFVPKGSGEWKKVIDALDRGEVEVGPLISHRASLDDAPSILDAMHKKSAWFNKVVITPGTRPADGEQGGES